MERQIVVLTQAIPALIAVIEADLERQRRIFDMDESEWPEDFDAHDILLLQDAVEQLRSTKDSTKTTAFLKYWKGMELVIHLLEQNVWHGIAVEPIH